MRLEDIETAIAAIHAEDESIDPHRQPKPNRRAGRRVLPKLLPRVEETLSRVM